MIEFVSGVGSFTRKGENVIFDQNIVPTTTERHTLHRTLGVDGNLEKKILPVWYFIRFLIVYLKRY